MSRAAQIESFDGLQSLRVIDRELPGTGAGEVLVRMGFAATHPLDALIAGGAVSFAKNPPLVLGAVGAGEVASDGADFQAGERVAILGNEMGMMMDGVWAEYAVVPERLLARVPAAADLATAATVGIAFPTAAIAVEQANMRDGGSMLVLGATGAVGSAAVQIAANRGIRVVAASRSESGAAFAAGLGADATVDLSSQSLAESAAALTDRGFDAIVDPVGGEMTALALKTLATTGTHVVLGYSAGFETTISLPELVSSRGRLEGCGMHAVKPERLRELERDCLDALAAGDLEAPLAGTYGIDEIPAAYQALEDPAVHGRVLLRLDEDS